MPSYLDNLITKYKPDKSEDKPTEEPVEVKKEERSIDLSAGKETKDKATSIDDIKDKPTEPTPETKDKPKELSKKEMGTGEKVEIDNLSSIKELVETQVKHESTNEQGKDDFDNKMVESEEEAHLIIKYGDIEIYRLKNQSMLHYKVPVPKPNPSQKIIINTLKEATTRLISTDPYKIRDQLQRKNIYYQKIMDILENAAEINIPKHMYSFYANEVVKEMVGYGVIEPFLNDDKLEEIMIVGPKKPVYVYHVDYGMMTTNITFFTDEGIQEIIDKIARTIGRHVDIASPLLDARLPDGSRVNATIPPASIDGSTVTIRKFKEDPYTIIDLINFKTVNLEVAAFLWCVVDGFGAKPANILISGGTGSGKTTTLNVLANFIPESDRILTIEDTAELHLPVKHVIRFEGRPPGIEGRGELSLEILTKNTLRMRPDRIIVGEIRHKEASTLFTAMNTGHDGCMGTVHANSAKETMVRLTSPPMNVPPLMLAGLDFIIIQKRLRSVNGQIRRITAIAEVTGVLENEPKVNIIFKWNPETDTLERTNEPILYFDIIKSYTNLSDENIKNRLEDRIKIMNNLINKKIRNISDVSKAVQIEYAKIYKQE